MVALHLSTLEPAIPHGSMAYCRVSSLETGGRAARDWLDAPTAPEPGEQVSSQDDHPCNPQARTTTETVLREAMQALWRVQAHMLARIVALHTSRHYRGTRVPLKMVVACISSRF